MGRSNAFIGVDMVAQPDSSQHNGTTLPIIHQTLLILRKDILLELRNRAAIQAILLFSITTLIVVGFSAGGGANLPPDTLASLLWIILFFSAFSGLSHVFIREEESNTAIALRLTSEANAVLWGKLLFNTLLTFVIIIIIAPLYFIILNAPIVQPGKLALSLLTGGIGLSVSATIIAVIIARSHGKPALFGAIGFPILLPMLFIAVDATRLTFQSYSNINVLNRDILGLASFDVLMIVTAGLLFPYVWESE